MRTKIQRLFRFLAFSATTPLPSSKKPKMVTPLHGVYQSQFQFVEILYHVHLRYQYLQELWEKKAAISVSQREEASPDEHPLCLLYQGSEWGGRLWSNIAGCCLIKTSNLCQNCNTLLWMPMWWPTQDIIWPLNSLKNPLNFPHNVMKSLLNGRKTFRKKHEKLRN